MRRISAQELRRWHIYEKLYGPLGPQRQDMLAAQLLTFIANSLRKKSGRAHKLSEFLLFQDEGDPIAAPSPHRPHPAVEAFEAIYAANFGDLADQ